MVENPVAIGSIPISQRYRDCKQVSLKTCENTNKTLDLRSARADIYLQTVVARASHLQFLVCALFICNLTLTCMVPQISIASHAYLRSARAPLPRFSE
eukprot:3993537-Pleurochrysis_carterae.AAC.1